MSFFYFSYQAVDGLVLRSITLDAGPIYKELFRSSQTYPTVLSARITKHLIIFLGKRKRRRWR